MASTNGMNTPERNAGRLPPQATPPKSPSPNRTDDDGRTPSSGSLKDQRSKSSKSGRGRRSKSSSDGVRQMQQQYQQQYQQDPIAIQNQYWANYGGFIPNQPSPMSVYTHPPGMAIPPHPSGFSNSTGWTPDDSNKLEVTGSNGKRKSQGSKSKGHRQIHSFSGAPGGYGSFGAIDLNPSSRNSSLRDGRPPREFSAMNEFSSVIGTSSSRSARGRPNALLMPQGGSPTKNFHRRNLSDSLAAHKASASSATSPMSNMGPVIMPNVHGGSFSSASGSVPFSPASNKGVYTGAGEVPSETEAFLAQTMGGGGNFRGNSSTRPKMHMRQHSVNLYMDSFKGKKQPSSCKDVFFAVLFLLQLVVVCLSGLKFGPDALVGTAEELGPSKGLESDDALVAIEDEDDNTKVVLAYWNIIKMAYTCGAFVIIVSGLALAFMMAMSRRLVYVALVLSIGVSFAWGTIGVGISPKSFVPITGIIALMLTVGYMFVVWDRIPFASANLTTALTGVRDNLGLVAVAFFFQFLALVCSIYYSFTFVGLHDAVNNMDLEVSDTWKVAPLVLLLISYYWTYQVLVHIVEVTVAGTVGSWWFGEPSALWSTFLQATVYSFGSICYGSLLVGFVQFLRQIAESLRPNRDESAMMCLYECCLFFQEKVVSCVDNLADSFTPWAFTYVGLYRYGLKEAGHKANELFERRGWSRLVTDDLIPSVLFMVSLVIGGLSGSFAVILQALDGRGLTSFGHPIVSSFMIGFMLGIVLSTVLFSIISSSVFAVIVCFAGSPVEFEQKHPDLSSEMRHAWREVWPGSLDIEGVGSNIL